MTPSAQVLPHRTELARTNASAPQLALPPAWVRFSGLESIDVTVDQTERTFQDSSIDPRVAEAYLAKGYDKAPLDWASAQAIGANSFNGMQSSCPSIEYDGSSLQVTLQPTRYLVGRAMLTLAEEGLGNKIDLYDISPRIANVSLLAVVKERGRYELLCQLRGNITEGGTIHAAVAAGSVSQKYLGEVNPLVAALKGETSEEVGMDVSKLNPGSFLFMVDESPWGGVNFACCATKPDGNQILHSYEDLTKAKLAGAKPLEVAALTKLPLQMPHSLVIIPLEEQFGIENVQCFRPTPEGLKIGIEDFGLHFYSEAVLSFLGNPDTTKALIEQAGY